MVQKPQQLFLLVEFVPEKLKELIDKAEKNNCAKKSVEDLFSMEFQGIHGLSVGKR
jgi:hypothetical protein